MVTYITCTICVPHIDIHVLFDIYLFIHILHGLKYAYSSCVVYMYSNKKTANKTKRNTTCTYIHGTYIIYIMCTGTVNLNPADSPAPNCPLS